MRCRRSRSIAAGRSSCWRVAILSTTASATCLLRSIPAGETLCLPNASAFSLAAARLGWSLQDVALVSLHGRALEGIVRHLQPGARILALSWDGETPAKLAKLLVERGMGGSALTVLEAMGGPRERVRSATAAGFDLADVAPLNTIALKSSPPPTRRCCRSRRASTIRCSSMTASSPSARSAPSPCRRWRRARASSCGMSASARARSPSNGCCAIPRSGRSASNREPARAARAARNAATLGTPDLQIVQERAPAAFAGPAGARCRLRRRRALQSRHVRRRVDGAEAGRPPGRQRGDHRSRRRA